MNIPATKAIIIVLVLVLVLVLGGWWFLKGTAPAPATPAESAVTPSPSTPATPSVSPETLTLSGSEFKYTPNTLSATVGQTVTIQYTNTGKYPHNFVIDELKVKSQTIKPGETATFSFTPSEAGTYAFYCSLPGHREKGMSGAFTVLLPKASH